MHSSSSLLGRGPLGRLELYSTLQLLSKTTARSHVQMGLLQHEVLFMIEAWIMKGRKQILQAQCDSIELRLKRAFCPEILPRGP